MAGQYDLSLDDLRSKVEQGSLGDDIDSIAGILSRVKPEDQAEAFRLYLGWVREIWRSQGAWDLLVCMPPALLPGQDGNAADFCDLLFPKVARLKPRVPKGPRDFWDWQQGFAKDVPGHLYPNRDAAREKWVMKCRRDPDLRRCVEDLASLYMKFVHFAASDPYPTRYEQPAGVVVKSQYEQDRKGAVRWLWTLPAGLDDQVFIGDHRDHVNGSVPILKLEPPMASERVDHLYEAAADACLHCHSGEPLPSGKKLHMLCVGPYELAQAQEAAMSAELLQGDGVVPADESPCLRRSKDAKKVTEGEA